MIEDEPRNTDREWPVPLMRGAALWDLNRLVEEEHLSDKAAQYVWDMLMQPLYDRRQLAVGWDSKKRCRRCQAMHPAHLDYDKSPYRQVHQMYCPKYVGPLEHRMRTSDLTFTGALRYTCSCGQIYPAHTDDVFEEGSLGENLCPDAAVDWRGPRPVE